MAKKKGKMAKAIKKALEEPVLDLSLDGEEETGEEIEETPEQVQAKEMKQEYFARMYSLGRRPAYENPEDLFADGMSYMIHCEAAHQMPNKAGLGVWLKMAPSTMRKYGTEEPFVAAIKELHRMIEDKWVQQLGNPFTRNSAGVIFYLKNAFKNKYRDSYSTDLRNNGKAVTFVLPAEIAQKHSVQVLEEEKKKDEVVEPQPTEQGEVVGAA